MIQCMNHDYSWVGESWAQWECCRPRRWGSDSSCRSQGEDPALLTLHPIMILLFLFPLSLPPSLCHLFPPLSLSQVFSYIFSITVISSIMLLSVQRQMRDWGDERASLQHTHSHIRQAPGPISKYNKQVSLLLEKPSSRLCMFVCVCPSGPWVLLSYQTLSLMTPQWFPLDNALQSDNLLFALNHIRYTVNVWGDILYVKGERRERYSMSVTGRRAFKVSNYWFSKN